MFVIYILIQFYCYVFSFFFLFYIKLILASKSDFGNILSEKIFFCIPGMLPSMGLHRVGHD